MSVQPLRDVQLANFTSLQLGGRARYFLEARADQDVIAAVEWAKAARVALYVLGGGSNLVIADSGISGLVLKIATQGISVMDQAQCVVIRANAGVLWDEVVRCAVERDLSGIECLSGIPGLAGATPIQNVGAYGQEVADALVRVTVYDRKLSKTQVLSREECLFGYRDSRFKSQEPDRFVVLSVEFELRRQAPSPIRHSELAAKLALAGASAPTVEQIRFAVLELRKQKGMLDQSMLSTRGDTAMRSAGSFFVNPVVEAEVARRLVERHGPAMPVFNLADGRVKLSAGWLIEQAGHARGERWGNVGLSPHHCLVLVCHDRADTRELVQFAGRVRSDVSERFGIELRPEPNFWGFEALQSGLPLLDEDAPPTLGSAPWPIAPKAE